MLAGQCKAAESVTAGFHPAAPASGPSGASGARRGAGAHASVPAANFLVEWRLQPADARPSPRGDVVITSGSAAVGGASGFGAGAVVVGTARVAAPQALRVANGKEGAIQFDRSETHTVYDMAWSARTSASSSTEGTSRSSRARRPASARAAGRVWSPIARKRSAEPRGRRSPRRRLASDAALDSRRHARARRGVDARGAHRRLAQRDRGCAREPRRGFPLDGAASFDEWLTVASVGDGGDELQIRVTWR